MVLGRVAGIPENSWKSWRGSGPPEAIVAALAGKPGGACWLLHRASVGLAIRRQACRNHTGARIEAIVRRGATQWRPAPITELNRADSTRTVVRCRRHSCCNGQTRTPKTHRLGSDAVNRCLRLLLGRGEAGAADRVRRHHRRRHAADQQSDRTRRAPACPDDKIQASLKAIVTEVTGDRRGPGGHILTGPVYVEGAEPGDVLEVKILSIDFAIDYGYNGCSGFIPENCDRVVRPRRSCRSTRRR